MSILVFSGCITIQDAEVCSVAGDITAGAICSHTLKNETRDMTLDEFILWLDGSQDDDPALCMKSSEWNEMKTELEQACRKLNMFCKYAEVLERLQINK